MSELYSRYIIICEGKSEKAYIQKLNIYFKEKCDIHDTVLIAKNAKGGHYATVEKKYREVCRDNCGNKDPKKNHKIYIWVDKDTYKRNDRHKDIDKYKKKPKNMPDFSFNIFNFEDFLMLHLPKEDFLKHRKLFEDEGHFKEPLISTKYEPLINKVFEGYKKGSLPNNFIISKESLKNLFANNELSKELSKDLQNDFAIDFANKLYNIIGKHLR